MDRFARKKLFNLKHVQPLILIGLETRSVM